MGGILSVFSVFIFPWWVVFLLALALMFHFKYFFEIIIIAILVDVLYGTAFVFNFPYMFTLLSIIIFYVIVRFKEGLILY